MNIDQITALAIGAAGLALTYAACCQALRLPKHVSAIIAFAFGIITYIYLLENPAVLADTKTRIAIAVIGAVVLVAYSVRRRYS